ncbi:MAG: hypothetical protein J6V93_01215 [Clostridia bacterium]|nr:hypothetical protein [Clostridia bacterium]
MKTELEFISGVYEKYAKEQEIRRKRVRMISTCATLSACACVAVFISVRTVPMLLNGGVKTAEDAAFAYSYTAASITADCAAEYEMYDYEIVEEEAQEEVLFDESLPAPTAKSQNEDAKIIMKSAGPKNKADNSFYGKTTESGLVKEAEVAYSINGNFTYALPLKIPTESVVVSINSELECEITSEAESVSGAHFGKCSEGYYVRYIAEDTLFILIKDTEAVSQDELKAIADSVVYYTEK